jgi:hypothetical protein
VSAQVPAGGSIAPRGSFVRVVLSRPSVVEDEVLATDDGPEEAPAAVEATPAPPAGARRVAAPRRRR